MTESSAQMDPEINGGDEDTFSNEMIFYVNGERKVVQASPGVASITLLEYLRSPAGGCLTGTKLGCGEGGCGACTVMVSSWVADRCIVQHRSVNACLAPLCSVDSCVITTVEGVSSCCKSSKKPSTKLHPVQERLASLHGSQCGFCTPGFVMSMYSELADKVNPTIEDMEKCIDGNLCRCTFSSYLYFKF